MEEAKADALPADDGASTDSDDLESKIKFTDEELEGYENFPMPPRVNSTSPL